jgi:hypothetical protein
MNALETIRRDVDRQIQVIYAQIEKIRKTRVKSVADGGRIILKGLDGRPIL